MLGSKLFMNTGGDIGTVHNKTRDKQYVECGKNECLISISRVPYMS
jgi:hypothetical protein